MPTTTQLASLVVSAFDTFLIVHNSRQLSISRVVQCQPETIHLLFTEVQSLLTYGSPPPPPGTHLHVAAARKRSHQWCISLTPNNSKTVVRMTRHCFLRPIRRDFEQLQHYSHIWKPWVHLPHPYILTYPLGASPKQKRSWSLCLESESIIFIVLSRVKTITMLCIFM